MSNEQNDLAAEICRAVAELPDRSSPEDWPEAMLVTHDELAEIVRAALASKQVDEGFTEAQIDAYLEDYEMRGEDEDGREACHTPTEGERFMIKDAILGLLAEADWRGTVQRFDGRAAAPEQPQAEPVEWGAPATAGKLIRQLQTFDPDTPVHGAVHTDYEGRRVSLVKPLTMSRERVAGRFIRLGDESVPYSLVIWSAQEPEQPQAGQRADTAHWFSLVMGAAAEIEDAANCLRDPDAKRKAISGAQHYRERANAAYAQPPALPAQPEAVPQGGRAELLAFINLMKGAAFSGPEFFTADRCKQMFDECVRLERATPPLQTEVERDAARYRWLRNNHTESYSMGSDTPAEHTVFWDWRQATRDEAYWSLDEAIDAAMSAQKEVGNATS